MDTSSSSTVADWYKDQHIFVTGASGFMGKVLVEKLLRSCPKVAAIYILIRSKKGKDAKQRLKEILKGPIFETLRDSPDGESVLEKVKCIDGDVTEKNCGISQEDQLMLKNSVTAVFHMAANVRFDQPVKSAVLMNTGGTRNVLDLACKFGNLKIFVHVSTSYCHCNVTKLEEKLYKAPHDPRRMLELVEWMDDELLETITPALLKNYPNSYAYTKCLTEDLVSEYSNRLPIVITRPSIVIATCKEPIPGWVDNINGPTGVLIGGGKGVIRSMHCHMNLVADIVPVDMAINSLLIVAWKVGTEARKNETEVYHITANRDNSVNWGQALELGRKYILEYPYSVCLWYPGGTAKSTYTMHLIAAFFFHLIPAYFVDFMLSVTGNKPFLVQTQKRIQGGLEVLQYYTTRPWFFYNDKLFQLYDTLSANDKKIFYTNREEIQYEDYMLNYVLGARKYCGREELDTLPHARKVLKRMYYLDMLKNVILIVFLLWILSVFASSFFK